MDRPARIRAYFESCNSGDSAEVAAHFSPDAIIYDTNHKPVRTAAGIGERPDTGLQGYSYDS